MNTPLRGAAVRAARIAYNAVVDARFGRLLAGERTTGFADRGAHDTENSDYLALNRLFAGRIRPDDVLVDVGCGRGRVINWWLRAGLTNRIIGIELDATVAERTRRRLARHRNVEIRTGDVLEALPEQGTLFYLFNPFNAEVVAAFAQRLAAAGQAGRDIRVLYNNPKHLEPFRTDAWECEIIDLGGSPAAPYGRAAVLRYRTDTDGSRRPHQA